MYEIPTYISARPMGGVFAVYAATNPKSLILIYVHRFTNQRIAWNSQKIQIKILLC